MIILHFKDMISSHVNLSMISLMSSLSLKLYLNSLVYHRNIFGSSSSAIFGNARKMFANVRLAFGTILENIRKCSESGRKSSENHQKRHHQYVYITKNVTRELEDMNFKFSWQEQYLTSECSHSNIKFISSRHRVISSV